MQERGLRLALHLALALAALALLIALPAAEETAEAWIHVWSPQRIDTDGDGAADGYNNSLSLATDLEEVNVTVAMVIYKNGTQVASLTSNYTLHRNATTDWGSPRGYWVALEWSTSENGSYAYETLLYSENGTLLDNRTYHSYYPLVAPGKPRPAIFSMDTLLDKTTVYLSAEPGNESIGFLNLTLNNTSSFWVDVSIQLFSEGLLVSPSALTVTLNPANSPNHSRTIPLAVLAPTGAQAGSKQVTINIETREGRISQGPIFKRIISFTAIVLPYSNLSLSAESVADSCPGNAARTLFMVHNDGNIPENVTVSVINRKSLEAKDYEIAAPTLFVLEPGANRTFLVELEIPRWSADLPVTLTIEVRGNWTGLGDADTVSVKLSGEGCGPLPALSLPASLAALGAAGAVAAVRRRR